MQPTVKSLQLQFHSTVARDITLKFDAANVERVASHTGSGWEALSYDFTGAMPADQTKIAFFNDLSQQGDGTDAWTIYIDNLAQSTGGDTGGTDPVAATIALPVDFEEAADAYEIAGFDGGVASVEAGPDGAVSLKYVKGAGQNWAGVWINLDTAVDAASGEVMTADVYSTEARDITLKFDVANVERVASHTGSGWESLSYDFTGAMPAGQAKIAFFNDLSQQGDGTDAWTIYIDNLAQASGGDTGGGDTGGTDPGPVTTTDFCATEVTHFNIPNMTNSVLLTVSNSGADSIDVTASSYGNDIDVLILEDLDTGATASDIVIADGVATTTISWPVGTMPATTSFGMLWSDSSNPGNMMVRKGDGTDGTDGLGYIDTSFVCNATGPVVNESNYCGVTAFHFGNSAEVASEVKLTVASIDANSVSNISRILPTMILLTL